MAHQISIVNGKAEAVYALQPAWHGLGTVFDHVPTGDEVLEKIGFTTELCPMQAIVNGKAINAPDFYATVRTDIPRVLGVVSERYHIVQVADMVDFCDSLMQDGVIRYEAAGVLFGGRKVFVLARMPSVDTFAEGDTGLRYVLFSSSFDGSEAIFAHPTNVRVVCSNTLQLAIKGKKGIKHTLNCPDKLAAARLMISQFDTAFTEFRDKARILATKQMTTQAAEEYINTLFPPVPEPVIVDPTARKSSKGTRRDNKVEIVKAAMIDSRTVLPSMAGTWWAGFNAISQYADHAATFKTTNGATAAENRMESILDGPSAELKDQAFNLACAMAHI